MLLLRYIFVSEEVNYFQTILEMTDFFVTSNLLVDGWYYTYLCLRLLSINSVTTWGPEQIFFYL